MSIRNVSLPPTMFSPETGEALLRDIRHFEVIYKGSSVAVDLPGF